MGKEITYDGAMKSIDEVINDNGKWNLLVEQVKSRQLPDINKFRYHESHKPFLAITYLLCSMHICDTCDYNPRKRCRKKCFSSKRRFECYYRNTKGDELAAKTAIEQGLPGKLYNLGDENWKEQYTALSKTVLEEHKDRTKAPAWLDTEKNTCKHYFLDLSKVC